MADQSESKVLKKNLIGLDNTTIKNWNVQPYTEIKNYLSLGKYNEGT